MLWPSNVTVPAAGAGVSGDQPRQRGLARAGPPDDRGQRARPRREGDSVQQFLAVDPEVNAVDLQAAGAGRGFGAADQVAVGEDEVDVADRDHVALVQHRRADADAVDEGAVDAVCVPDLGAERRVDQERVMTRSQHILDHDVVVVGATDRRRTRRLVRSREPGRIAWIILVARLPTSGGVLIAGGAISVFGATVHRGSRSHRGGGLPDAAVAPGVAGPAGRPAGAGLGSRAEAGHRDTGATVPGRSALAVSARRRGVAAVGRVPAGRAPAIWRSASTSSAAAGHDTVVASDLETSVAARRDCRC